MQWRGRILPMIHRWIFMSSSRKARIGVGNDRLFQRKLKSVRRQAKPCFHAPPLKGARLFEFKKVVNVLL
jgi:hypothetical protein